MVLPARPIFVLLALSIQALLEEIRRGGVVDSAHQSLLLTLCALGPQEVNEVRDVNIHAGSVEFAVLLCILKCHMPATYVQPSTCTLCLT